VKGVEATQAFARLRLQVIGKLSASDLHAQSWRTAAKRR
jgi:hypothetical protein